MLQQLSQHLNSVQTGSGNMLRDVLVDWYVSQELNHTATAQERAHEAVLCRSVIKNMVKKHVLVSSMVEGPSGQQQQLSVHASYPVQQASSGPPRAPQHEQQSGYVEELSASDNDEEVLASSRLGGQQQARQAGEPQPQPQESEQEKLERQELQQKLFAEQQRLRNEQRNARRDADGFDETMLEQCFDMLKLWGVPWVVAPFEAEAQCAALEQLGLVDGTVTNDSDAFLFGSKTVYR